MIIYQIVKDLIQEKLSSVTQLKTIDWYNQQYTNTQNEEAEQYPAVYIEIDDSIAWEDLPDGIQAGDINIRLHVVINSLLDTPEQCLITSQAVFRALQGVALFDATDNQITTELCRRKTELVKRFDMLKVSIMKFECHCWDVTGMPEYDTAMVQPVITAGVV
jgi:hypothetical protein